MGISEEESVANFRKAYELREHVSDRERFYIEAHYQESVTGDWKSPGSLQTLEQLIHETIFRTST